jgi:hypothetical protein
VDEQKYTLKAGESACPWCGALTKHDLIFPVPMILKCQCGGMWVMCVPGSRFVSTNPETRPPDDFLKPKERDK